MISNNNASFFSKQALKKIFRFIIIYGIPRTFVKVIGRVRRNYFIRPFYLHYNQNIGLIGCGQFQFSTIAYFLSKGFKNCFLYCYDVAKEKASFLANFYSIPNVYRSENKIYHNPKVKLVYVASNHSTHSHYAISFLEKDVNVFCEKPISVSFEQFRSLLNAIYSSKANFYAGYNRPYSPAIVKLKEKVKQINRHNGKFTINCFVSAHDIPADHWYRNPEEGTRICGNVGHWIDLMIHIYNWRGFIPNQYKIQIAYSNKSESDDNINISITTKEQDLTSITITSRTEPFEGINETINFQYHNTIAKIDDFRKITIWQNHKLFKKRFWPKDVGHKRSVMQPFRKNNRDLIEVIASTELMLHISDMVQNKESEKVITLNETLK